MKIGNIWRGAIRIGNTWRVNLVLTAAISLGVFFFFFSCLRDSLQDWLSL